jgi:hypothetical protein
MQHTSKRSSAGDARASFAARLLLALLALALHPAIAAGPSAGGAPLRNPQLESLQIEIWPEYDRQAALVIFRAALAADTKLPATVHLRIPASSGGPSAMAYATAASGNLLNLPYERKDAGDAITLQFSVPERYFHVEFYDRLATGVPERAYTYTWPGDMGIGQLRVIMQEPAAVSNFSTQPKLDATASGQDGLRYHSAELGMQAAGKPLPISVRYTKADARTSAEILHPSVPAAAPAPAANSKDDVTKGVLLFILVISLLVGLGTAVLWWRGRPKASAARAGAAGACGKCGAPRAAGDRFCPNCGARLKHA